MMSAGSAIFCYDANGNMTQKIAGSTTSYTYDAENRMTAVSGAATATFVYDGDGNRVKGVVGGVTTTYIGNYFEWTPSGKTTLRVQAGSTSTMKKYYYAGGAPSGEGKRVAERKGTTLYWLLSDHLGSTSITANSSGSKTAELRYKAWGETRYTYGTTQTTIRYTGQREESSLGLYWYASRWYSPGLSRFVSPDTIIPQPGSPLAWDRYAYTNNNPIRFTDPSGHVACDGEFSGGDYCDSTGIGRGQKRLQSPVPQNNKLLEGPYWKAATTPETNSPASSNEVITPDDLLPYKWLLEQMDRLSTYEDFINMAKPIYKQVKYAIPTGGIEAVVDAALYGLTDRWSTSLTPGQRIGRMFIVGAESAIIDQFSAQVGVLGNLVGGPLGGVAAEYLSSAIITDHVMPSVTWLLFESLNFGAPAFFPQQ